MFTCRLSSNFDIYQTLKDIALLEIEKNSRSPPKPFTTGESLFHEELPKQRVCAEAGIPKNFCVCMEQRKMSRLNNESQEYRAVANEIKHYLTKNVACAETDSLKILDDKLNVFSLNQMVRHGLRDANL